MAYFALLFGTLLLGFVLTVLVACLLPASPSGPAGRRREDLLLQIVGAYITGAFLCMGLHVLFASLAYRMNVFRYFVDQMAYRMTGDPRELGDPLVGFQNQAEVSFERLLSKLYQFMGVLGFGSSAIGLALVGIALSCAPGRRRSGGETLAEPGRSVALGRAAAFRRRRAGLVSGVLRAHPRPMRASWCACWPGRLRSQASSWSGRRLLGAVPLLELGKPVMGEGSRARGGCPSDWDQAFFWNREVPITVPDAGEDAVDDQAETEADQQAHARDTAGGHRGQHVLDERWHFLLAEDLVELIEGAARAQQHGERNADDRANDGNRCRR